MAGACADIEDQKLLVAEKEKQAKQKAFFLNALSHDLRAPLHNVLLNAQLLKMTATEQLEVESLTMIIENTLAAGDLVSRLLDFAGSAPGKQHHPAGRPRRPRAPGRPPLCPHCRAEGALSEGFCKE